MNTRPRAAGPITRIRHKLIRWLAGCDTVAINLTVYGTINYTSKRAVLAGDVEVHCPISQPLKI
jgi:hypothetical protein